MLIYNNYKKRLIIILTLNMVNDNILCVAIDVTKYILNTRNSRCFLHILKEDLQWQNV